jgi:hypothetical protein
VPPDLGKPYTSEDKRASDREALIIYWYGIDSLVHLAEKPASRWTPQEVSLFPSSVPGGPPEHPENRLRRWLTLYTDEINIIRDVRNRLVHASRMVIVTDPELRGATWLARQVLSTAMGTLPSQVEPDWVRTTLAPLAR